MQRSDNMKIVIHNEDNLKESEINKFVYRARGVIINSNNEVLMGSMDNVYQFPGGHLEGSETLEECLIREIKEETGIELNNYDIKPFFKTVYYTKNYHNSGKNRKNEIYFYIIKTDKVYNMDNSNLDDWEREGNYELRVMPLCDVENILINSIKDNPINEVIVGEMLEVIKEYKSL